MKTKKGVFDLSVVFDIAILLTMIGAIRALINGTVTYSCGAGFNLTGEYGIFTGI